MAEPPLPGTAQRFRWRAFHDAWNGLRVVVRTQPNARFHFAASAVVLVAGGLLRVSGVEWALLIAAIGMVWMAELLNTAIEWTVDLACPERRQLAGWAKDAAAAAVLMASVVAAIIGALVFGPRVLAWWS